MLKTPITELFNIEVPIICAGMGAVALAELAAAVSEAGGLGTIGLAAFGRESIANELTAARHRTAKPLAANLIIPFLRPGIVEAVVQSPIQVLTFFWGDAREQRDDIAAAHRAGIKVMWQCGTPDEARWAKEAGVDAVMSQGFEAGGHVRGETTSLALIPEVRDAIGDLPMVAAGGFADGRGLAAALALGADGVVFGTRFAASIEAASHAQYRQQLVEANARDTFHSTLFDIGWPDAPHRVLRTDLVKEWQAAGSPASGARPHEGEIKAASQRADIEIPLVNYTVMPPADYIQGNLEGLPFYAGQSCSQVHEILSAAGIIRRAVAEAESIIARRLPSMMR